MSELQVFQFAGQQVRTELIGGEPHFLLKDVCEVLDLGQVAGVKRRLEKDVISNHPLETSGGTQNSTFINESGLYDVIMDSRKLEAKQFRKWVTSEVIPQIRKTGSYHHQKEPESQSEFLLMYAQRLVEQEKEIKDIKDQADAAHHRIDNMDNLDHIGDLQQRLNKMIRRYVADNGLTHAQGWRKFREAYNTAFHTNITLRMENYKFKRGLKNLSAPEYLKKTEQLEDAIRVADKMLNTKKEGAL